ncbi:hypothetical protein CHUAL_004754 [Chamberlinius hualienensis]
MFCRMQEIWEMNTLERRYSVPPSTISDPTGRGHPVEDLHAWSIYRQNINSGFTDSALGSSEKSSPPYGNFKLRESTVHSIMTHPKYGPNARPKDNPPTNTAPTTFSYLKFGLPRVFPLFKREGSSGYDSSDEGGMFKSGHQRGVHSPVTQKTFPRSRSEPDFRANGAITSNYDSDHQNSPYNHHHSPSYHLHSGVAAKLRHEGAGSEFSANSSYFHDRRGQLNKSNSEANLLNISSSSRNFSGDERRRYRVYTKANHNGPSSRSGRNTSVDEVASQSERGLISGAGKRSQAGSHMSVLSHTTRSSRTHIGAFNALAQAGGGLYSREAQLLNEKFFPKDTFITTYLGDIEGGVFKHPHLQVRNLSYEIDIKDSGWPYHTSGVPFHDDRCRLLDSITLEVHGGEIMAVMTTSEEEGTIFLNVLANRHLHKKVRIRGDLVVNGVVTLPDKLENRVSLVQQDCNFSPDMSVRQTLLFTSLLKEPGNPSRGFDTKGRINALIEDLGLSIVKHTRVKHLTLSEKRRLNVACHLLLDTDIVLLDQPTKGMDIFDTFFLVEYLRQWAARGRLVILTIHPPTYEIFTMMSKIALISCGKLMYFGKRREMLPYFAFIEFPCPAYKNPSDYYLDLVTLDNLSAEAMLESSERIKLLADTFQSRQEPLSDPGPPGIPPPKVKSGNFLVQILALWIRALIYMFPYNLINLGKNIFIVAIMSVLIGAIYWNVRLQIEQDAVQDRFGYHYVMMGVAIWPLIFITITEVWSNKDVISRDFDDRMYTKTAYFISKMTYSYLTAEGVFLAYIIPAYCMSGLKGEDDNRTFSTYLGYMLLYLLTIRTLSMAMSFTFSSRHTAAAAVGFVLTLSVMTGGYVVQFADLSIILYWFKWVSPTKWILEIIDTWDMLGTESKFTASPTDTFSSKNAFSCSKDQPVASYSAAIILKPPCSFSNGYEALAFYDYLTDWPLYVPILCTFAFGLFWFIWLLIAFSLKKQKRKTSRNREQRLLR